MLHLRRRGGALAAALAVSLAASRGASAQHYAYVLNYRSGSSLTIACPANKECSVALQRGEKVNNGYTSGLGEWQPHIAYVGDQNPQPYIILQPRRSGLHDNMILTTTKRAYRITLESNGDSEPAYYEIAYPEELEAAAVAHERARRQALEARVARAGGAGAPPTPTPQKCFDVNYSASKPFGTKNQAALKAADPFHPIFVCNDGAHTFVQLQQFTEAPSDLPVLFYERPTGQVLANYTYDAKAFRFIVDGVPESLLLEMGTPADRVTVRLTHYAIARPTPTATALQPSTTSESDAAAPVASPSPTASAATDTKGHAQ